MLSVETIKGVIIGLILLAAFVGLPYFYHQNELNKDRLNDAVEYSKIVRDSVEVYKNRNGELVTRVEASRLDNATILKFKEDLQKITSHFDDVNKRLSNVESLSKVTLSALREFNTSLRDTTVRVDSIDRPAFTFEDKNPHFSASGLVVPSLKTVSVKVQMDASVSSVVYWKRKHKIWFVKFGPKEYKAEIVSDNPFLSFKDYQVVIKKQR